MKRWSASLPRPVVLAGLALFLGGLAALFLMWHIQDRVREAEDKSRLVLVERVVAATDLPAGTRLAAEHLALRGFPARWVGHDTVPPGRYGELEGQTLTTALKAGDAIVAAHVARRAAAFSAQLAPGRRAITLPVDQVNSLSGLLQPGDLIDLYVSFDYQRKRLTAPLLQGVLVLATGRDTTLGDAPVPATAYSTVTLDAAPEDVVKLVAARQAGTITAILRHPEDDHADRRAARGDLAALLGVAARPPAPARKAVILYGSSPARGLPAWAKPNRASGPVMRGPWFDLPEGQALVSAWMRAQMDGSAARSSMVLPDDILPAEANQRPGDPARPIVVDKDSEGIQ